LKIQCYCFLDLLNFISLPYDEIKVKPEWAFNIAYTGEEKRNTVLEVQTWKGNYAVDPITLLALIFIGSHKEAERVSGKLLKKVFIKKAKPLTTEDDVAIKSAIKIARLECAGIEEMAMINVE
jgi:hypothetical protein